MKSIDDALELRGRIFGAFELAELEDDPAVRQRLMTFVIVGAGPTGVEMAGQIVELAHRTLQGDFRRIDPRNARIILLDAAPRVLPGFARATVEEDEDQAREARHRRPAGRHGRRDGRDRDRRQGRRRRPSPDRGRHEDLGGRRPGEPAGQAAGRADRRRDRPRRPRQDLARPHPAGAPGDLRRRRHARSGLAGRRAGGDAEREVRREADRRPARRHGRAQAVPATSTRAAWRRSRDSPRSRRSAGSS